jgi:hypothetical protein
MRGTGSARADRDYLNLRGEVLPFVRLRKLFEAARASTLARKRGGGASTPAQGRPGGGHAAGRIPDRDQAAWQMFRQVRGISGSTILGSGEVALILDVQALVSRCARAEEQPRAATPAVAGLRRIKRKPSEPASFRQFTFVRHNGDHTMFKNLKIGMKLAWPSASCWSC